MLCLGVWFCYYAFVVCGLFYVVWCIGLVWMFSCYYCVLVSVVIGGFELFYVVEFCGLVVCLFVGGLNCGFTWCSDCFALGLICVGLVWVFDFVVVLVV